MLGPTEFRDIVSGRHRGGRALLARAIFRIVETPYTLAVRWRNRRYDTKRAEIHRVSVPVISVGNLTLGGTGKTPMVKWLVRWLGNRGERAAIVSRGYGSKAGQHNDEAQELANALPGVPHFQDRDRVAAARKGISESECSVIVLDDGFQHRRLARNLDIVLIDALEPFGFEHVFPRGTLREPAEGLSRAQVVCLSRADIVGSSERAAIRQRVEQFAPRAIWCELAHAPSLLINSVGESQPLEALRATNVAAFCGIGNPAGFRHTLSGTDCEIAAWREYPDHHSYTAADIEGLTTWAEQSGAEIVVCTQKDLVKVRQQTLGTKQLWAVAIEMKFLAGQKELESAVDRVLKGRH